MSKNEVEFSIIALDRFSKQFASLRTTINRTAKVAAGFGAAFAAAAVIATKSLIEVGSKTENFRIRMNAMLGDVGEGNKVFREMAEFAGKVPFAYEDIMSSATTLSGILKGGSEEIKATMPIIADLAAVSGLSIQQTTDQVVRLYSAGAGAADLFRERGINAMLGFQAGVSVTAEESKKALIAAFEDPSSKFRGAANKMATTWTGIMSLIGDKWFNMRSTLADAGVFNFFKSIAIVLNDLMGEALDNTKKNAASMSNSIIDGIRAVIDAVGFVADAFRGLEFVFIGLQVVFAKIAEAILKNLLNIVGVVGLAIQAMEKMGLIELNLLNGTIAEAEKRTIALNLELQKTAALEMPSAAVERFSLKVEETFAKLQDLSALTQAAVVDTAKIAAAEAEIQAEEMKTRYDTFLEEMGLSTETFSEQFNNLMGSSIDTISQGIGAAIASGTSLAQVFQRIGRQVLGQLIGMLVKMGVQRLLFSALTKGAITSESVSALAASNALVFSNAFASTAAIPIIGPFIAPGVAAAASAANLAGSAASGAAGASLGATVGIAHGGLTNVPRESTFLLDKGERVLSPNQNRDFTDFIGGNGGGSGISVENVNITISTSASSFDAIADSELDEFVADSIIVSLDRLDDAGVRPKALERSNA